MIKLNNKTLRYFCILADILISVSNYYAQKNNPEIEHANLKKELAAGWNTCSARSVLSHVLLIKKNYC